MIKLIVSEFYKIFHRPGMLLFTVILLLAALFIATMPLRSQSAFLAHWEQDSSDLNRAWSEYVDEPFETFDEFWQWYPNYAIARILSDRALTYYILVFIFPAIYFNQDFMHRNMNGAIYCGNSRLMIFVAKVLTYFFTVIVFVNIAILCEIQKSVPHSWSVLPAGYIVRGLVLRTVMDISVCSIALIFAFFFKDMFRTIMVTFVAFYLSTLLKDLGILPADEVPFSSIWLQSSTWADCIPEFAKASVKLFVSIPISYYVFYKTDFS